VQVPMVIILNIRGFSILCHFWNT